MAARGDRLTEVMGEQIALPLRRTLRSEERAMVRGPAEAARQDQEITLEFVGLVVACTAPGPGLISWRSGFFES
ncbi:hypothetical protein Aros01_02413 [Streptosporangium roseum]|uniref:Uncharacterized protein n=1 Tax=Streptosporangium roseum (strain ATCC 12428 / DSM 43021 / JCM 3005 / KCTC 9067 / NCIMB 10171 / NRRL 2505 / NI 9100) TaxID=479432 RepID=D2AZT8_STRRD|nr:hypothetical protein Sros_4279 [Streptosporangium roseum DSM 43021]